MLDCEAGAGAAAPDEASVHGPDQPGADKEECAASDPPGAPDARGPAQLEDGEAGPDVAAAGEGPMEPGEAAFATGSDQAASAGPDSVAGEARAS
jgi:hypothetical protein